VVPCPKISRMQVRNIDADCPELLSIEEELVPLSGHEAAVDPGLGRGRTAFVVSRCALGSRRDGRRQTENEAAGDEIKQLHP